MCGWVKNIPRTSAGPLGQPATSVSRFWRTPLRNMSTDCISYPEALQKELQAAPLKTVLGLIAALRPARVRSVQQVSSYQYVKVSSKQNEPKKLSKALWVRWGARREDAESGFESSLRSQQQHFRWEHHDVALWVSTWSVACNLSSWCL